MLLKLLRIIKLRTLLLLLCGMFFAHSEIYALPSFIEKLCKQQGFDFCTGSLLKEKTVKQKEVQRPITESEKQVLIRLIDKEKQLKARESVLERKQKQLKTLEEDLQRQITQLEKLQKEVEKDINRKKIQDRDSLNKLVEIYAKMEPAKAAASIEQLNIKIAVQILLKIKEQIASNILSQMDAKKSARLAEEIARKN